MSSKVIWLVFKKELLDIFRDRKTLILSIVVPLILFPVLFGVMGKSVNDSSKKVEENLKVSVVDKDKNSNLGQFLKAQKTIKIIESKNVEEDIKAGKILAAIEIPENFEENMSNEATANIKLIYDNSSQQSEIAMRAVNSLIEVYSKSIVAERLSKRNINVDILSPVNVELTTTENEDEGMGKFMLSLLLPLMLVIYTVTGPMGAAVDLGAGEKERGTLEPLLTTQAGRMSLLWGKFLAITTMGLLSTVASLGGLFISMKQKDGFFGGISGGIDAGALLLIGAVTLLLTMVFGALELSISIYARSFKEAQTYISPLMIVSFIPTYATYMLDAKNIETFYFHIPLANAVCLLKELVAGIYNYTHMGITFAWIVVYILASVLFSRYMFSREEVIFRT